MGDFFVASQTLRSGRLQLGDQYVRLKTLQVRNAARAAAPAKTGRLRQSIQHRYRRTATGLVGEVYTSLLYGVILSRGGKRQYRILPVRKKALAWDGMTAGHPVRAVHKHPRVKKNDFLLRGLRVALGKGGMSAS